MKPLALRDFGETFHYELRGTVMVPRLVLRISMATWHRKPSKPWWWMRDRRDHWGAWRMVMIFREFPQISTFPREKALRSFRCTQTQELEHLQHDASSTLVDLALGTNQHPGFRLVDDRLVDGSNLNSVRIGFVNLPNQAGSLDYLVYIASYLQSTSYRSALRSKWWYQNIWQRGIVFPLRDEPFFWKLTK